MATLNVSNFLYEIEFDMSHVTIAGLIGVFTVAWGIHLAYGAWASGSIDSMLPGVGLVMSGGFMAWLSIKLGG